MSLTDLFQPNTLLPSQLGASTKEWPGECRLMLAVLDEAVVTIMRRSACVSPEERRQIDAAERWLASEDRESPFSFLNIAEALGLDPEYLRRGIREARDGRREIARRKREWSQGGRYGSSARIHRVIEVRDRGTREEA